MRSRFRSLVATAAIPFLLLAGTPADAANANIIVIEGSGTISPGLGLIPEPQSISFTGTATVVGTDGVLATYSCDFNGDDLAGSVSEGVGTLSGGCGPMTFDVCAWVRVGSAWAWVCVLDLLNIGKFHCVITVHQLLPTTSFDARCHGAGVHFP